MTKSIKGEVTPSDLALRDKHKALAREGLTATATLKRRLSSGDFGVKMRHDLKTIRGVYECITDDRDFLPQSSDWELDKLSSELLSELIPLEERLAAGRVQ